MRLRRIAVRLAVLLAGLAALRGHADAQPAHWQAFAHVLPGRADACRAALQSAPEVVLFDDGRLVWLDLLHQRNGEGQNPAAWRTAVLSVRERIDFRHLVDGSQIYTLQPPAEALKEAVADTGALRIGACTRGPREVLLHARYRAETLALRRWIIRMNEVYSALRVLTQRVSAPYRPAVVRVGVVAAAPVSGAPEWPAPVQTGLLEGRLVEYRGEAAAAIIDTLSTSSIVTIEGRTWRAAWAPVLDVPAVAAQASP